MSFSISYPPSAGGGGGGSATSEVLHTSSSSVVLASTSTTTTTMATYTIPANTLTSDGQMISIYALGTTSIATGTCEFNIRLGSTRIFQHTWSSRNGIFETHLTLVRTGGSAQMASSRHFQFSTIEQTPQANFTEGTEDWSTGLKVALEGKAGDADPALLTLWAWEVVKH